MNGAMNEWEWETEWVIDWKEIKLPFFRRRKIRFDLSDKNYDLIFIYLQYYLPQLTDLATIKIRYVIKNTLKFLFSLCSICIIIYLQSILWTVVYLIRLLWILSNVCSRVSNASAFLFWQTSLFTSNCIWDTDKLLTNVLMGQINLLV